MISLLCRLPWLIVFGVPALLLLPVIAIVAIINLICGVVRSLFSEKG
jgi:hypothetical protein